MGLSNFIAKLLESDDQPLDPGWPLAGEMVDGREVVDRVDNTASIDASLENPEILKGIREVPMKAFRTTGRHYSVQGTSKIVQLADRIRASNQIMPLIVAVDHEGPWILEGATRIEALHLLGAKSFPALVVVERGND